MTGTFHVLLRVIAGDNVIMEAEFKDAWLTRDLGDEVSARYLFSRADTDKDGSITHYPDMQRVYHYFDLDGQSWH